MNTLHFADSFAVLLFLNAGFLLVIYLFIYFSIVIFLLIKDVNTSFQCPPEISAFNPK